MGAAHAVIEAETPQRAGQIGLRPGLAQLFLAARDRRLEPAVPAVDEGTAEPPMDEVPLRRNLAVEARRTCRRLSFRCAHMAPGHRNCLSSCSVNGFVTLLA